MMYIGCRLGSEALFIIPQEWQHTWCQAGGHILRAATEAEGIASEPTLLVISPTARQTEGIAGDQVVQAKRELFTSRGSIAYSKRKR